MDKLKFHKIIIAYHDGDCVISSYSVTLVRPWTMWKPHVGFEMVLIQNELNTRTSDTIL